MVPLVRPSDCDVSITFWSSRDCEHLMGQSWLTLLVCVLSALCSTDPSDWSLCSTLEPVIRSIFSSYFRASIIPSSVLPNGFWTAAWWIHSFSRPVIALTSSSPATEDVLWSHGGKSDSSYAIIQRINGSNLFASTANVDLTEASQVCHIWKWDSCWSLSQQQSSRKQRIVYKRTYILYIWRIWRCARFNRSGFFLMCMCQHDHLRLAISCPLINTQSWNLISRLGTRRSSQLNWNIPANFVISHRENSYSLFNHVTKLGWDPEQPVIRCSTVVSWCEWKADEQLQNFLFLWIH